MGAPRRSHLSSTAAFKLLSPRITSDSTTPASRAARRATASLAESAHRHACLRATAASLEKRLYQYISPYGGRGRINTYHHAAGKGKQSAQGDNRACHAIGLQGGRGSPHGPLPAVQLCDRQLHGVSLIRWKQCTQVLQEVVRTRQSEFVTVHAGAVRSRV
jgi:hypothetical protein